MFGIFKYFAFTQLYKRARGSFITLGLSLAALIVTGYLASDFAAAAHGSGRYLLLAFKWIVILGLLVLIGRSLLRILSVAAEPFQKRAPAAVDERKERLMRKTKLQSRSDRILQRYGEIAS